MENADLHGARKRLPKLIDRAQQGKNFIITRAGKPRVHLTAVDSEEGLQMTPGLLASEVAAALKEFIITGYETETLPFKGEYRLLVEKQQDDAVFIKGPFPVMRQYEAKTGSTVFTPSKGLPGVGLSRKASKKELTEGTHYSLYTPDQATQHVALGWEDILHLQEGTVTKTFTDDTLPGGPEERTIEYRAPFFKPDREEDYRVTWGLFTS